MSSKDTSQLIRRVSKWGRQELGKELVSHGKRSCHYKIKCPDGSLYIVGGTPSDRWVLKKVKHELKKRGFPEDIVRLWGGMNLNPPEGGIYFFFDPIEPEYWERRNEGEWDDTWKPVEVTGRDGLPSVGSLVSLTFVRNSEVVEKYLYAVDKLGLPEFSQTPPILVLGWFSVVDEDHESAFTDNKEWLYLYGIAEGRKLYIQADEEVFTSIILGEHNT